MKLVKNENEITKENISDKEAEEAFIKILKWMGEDPSREGLLETPKRVVKAFKEYFRGYKENPKEILNKTFGDVNGYDDMVIQKKFLKKLLETSKDIATWLFKKISQFKVIANIIWHQLLVLHTLHIYQMKEW